MHVGQDACAIFVSGLLARNNNPPDRRCTGVIKLFGINCCMRMYVWVVYVWIFNPSKTPTAWGRMVFCCFILCVAVLSLSSTHQLHNVSYRWESTTFILVDNWQTIGSLESYDFSEHSIDSFFVLFRCNNLSHSCFSLFLFPHLDFGL